MNVEPPYGARRTLWASVDYLLNWRRLRHSAGAVSSRSASKILNQALKEIGTMAKRRAPLRSAAIYVFPSSAHVDVYEFAQRVAALPLDDREAFIEQGLANALRDLDERFPEHIANARFDDLERAIRHFLSGMKKSRRRKSLRASTPIHSHHHGDVA